MPKAKILGKLRGLIASASEKSRNGRRYTEEFWDTLFNSELFKEGIENKVYFGELWHPDTDEQYSQVHGGDIAAVVLTDVKKQGLDYYGTFEILPTTAGQTLRNLLDVGCIFGVSSRGLADYDTSVFDRNLAETYDLITWDLVAFPGIKSCRLHEVGAVAEGLKFKPNKQKVMENLNKLSKEDKYIKQYIAETLKAKEDFNTQLQIEDIMAQYGIPEDLIQYGNYVFISDDGTVFANDGEHGEAPVNSNYLSYTKNLEPNSVYLVDTLIYQKDKDSYFVSGEWTKLN